MVIDDDDQVRELVSLHLRNEGYEVVAAKDPVEGGHAVLQTAPALIICDVEMPYLNGYEFVAALKAHATTRDIPIVFLTGKDDAVEHARKLGAVAHLGKPVRADRLLEVVGLFA